MQVEVGSLVAGLFTNTTASVVFFGALHSVRCLTKQVPLLGSAAHKTHLVAPRLNIQVSHQSSPNNIIQHSPDASHLGRSVM